MTGIKGFGTVSGALGRGSEGLEDLLNSGAEYLPDVAGLVNDRKSELDLLIKNLAVVTRLSYDNLKSVEDTLDWLPVLLNTLIDAYDPATNRFRFGQLAAEVRNLPCSYNTPRRTVEATGNASYHPILDFGCAP